MDINLPGFKYLNDNDGSYQIVFDEPMRGYTKREADSIVRRLNALVECEAAIRDQIVDLLTSQIERP